MRRRSSTRGGRDVSWRSRRQWSEHDKSRVGNDCQAASEFARGFCAPAAHAQWAPKAPASKELEISAAHLLPFSSIGCVAQVRRRRLPACRLLTLSLSLLRCRPRGKGWSARTTRAHLPANRFALTRALFASDPPYYRPINLLSRRLPPCAHIFARHSCRTPKLRLTVRAKISTRFQSVKTL